MKHNKRGFTLIELLVVVLIIGILSAIALPQYQKAVEKSHLAEALSVMSSLERAIAVYLLENGYPSSQVRFLGDSPGASLDITIETSRRRSNSSYGGIAETNYFTYNAYCGNGFCDIIIYRTQADGTQYYRLFKRRYDSGTVRSCYPINNSNVGTQICTLLSKEGWNLGDNITTK